MIPIPFNDIVLNPINIVIHILLVCLFEIIVTILLIRRKEIRKDASIEVKKNPTHNKKVSKDKVSLLNNELEPYGFAYQPENDLFYSIMNGWQRDFGYCQLYDEVAALIVNLYALNTRVKSG